MLKLPRRRRRTGEMPGLYRQVCVDYYATTHSARALAAMLVDLEWREGLEAVCDEPQAPREEKK